MCQTTKSTKGKKWEDIYTPEECEIRRERMKHNNPVNNMSEETKQIRIAKLRQAQINYQKINGNQMQGRHHTEETKLLQSSIKKDLFNTSYKDEHIKRIRNRIEEYKKANTVVFTCLECNTSIQCLKSFINYKTTRVRKFCSPKCQQEYARKHPYIKYEPNSWERFIINLNIPDVKFTGNFTFWCTLNFKDRLYHKNPDFIIKDFSKTHAVIEVLGKLFHPASECAALAEAYADANIKALLLTNKDFTKKNLDKTTLKIKEFVANVIK